MDAKRIVSFLPSATELLFELGVQDRVFGVTHECIYPEAAKDKPRVIRSIIDPEKMRSSEIDRTVSELARYGKDLFIVDEDNLRKADPDLIIAQGTCAVCSAYTSELNKAMQILSNRPQVEVLDPHTIDDIFDSVKNIARRIDAVDQANRLVESLKKRITSVRMKGFRTKPKVLCIEWIEPFFTAGHWIPEMIHIAGGTTVIGEAGMRSRRMSIDEVESADPDIIVVMPCGFDTARTHTECISSLAGNAIWKNLRAVKENQVFGVDANSYFSKPSIRIVTGIEILAKIIHPDETHDMSVPADSYSHIKF